MLGLDSITIFFLTGISHLVLALALWVFRFEKTDRKLAILWFAGQLAAGIGMLLILGRRDGALFWFSTLPNALIFLNSGLFLMIVRMFFGWRDRWLWALPLFIVPLQFVIPLLGLPENWRLFLITLSTLLFSAVLVLSFWQQKSQGYSLVPFLMLANLAIAIAYTSRLLETAFASPYYDFFNAGAGQELALIALFVSIQLNGFGFLLLLKEKADKELIRLATLDPLTETLNRRSFVELSRQQLALSHRTLRPVSALICDIDHFKNINDKHGHHAGDKMICALVQVARDTLRTGDSIGRWGGEEFVILLPHTALQGAVQLAGRLNARFAAHSFSYENKTLAATISIGVAENLDNEDIQDTIIRADKALYRAKEQGRNRVEYDSTTDDNNNIA